MDLQNACKERFLRYVKVDTASDENSGTHPSTKGQFDLAHMLVDELKKLGADDIFFDEEHCYIYAVIKGREELPKIGFISHMDTSPDASGRGIKPQIHENYDGGDLGHIKVDEFPELNLYIGQTLITSDGSTLLGSDDKSGIAEIMTMVEYYMTESSEEHGDILVAFTPDEEIGEGTMFFDLDKFKADFAYTVDGGILGELSYENFNAASAIITINGKSVHPGEAYGKMVNALRVAGRIDSQIPSDMRPEVTREREGFFHLTDITGDNTKAVMKYIIRDHDMEKFEQKKELMRKVCSDNGAYVDIKDTYYNMLSKIKPHMHIVERAKDAMKKVGVEPLIFPIRGGTDGAMLSFKGLPCPNICAGGHNFHGEYEFVSVQAMGKIVQILIEIAGNKK